MARQKHPWNSARMLALILSFLLLFSILPIALSALAASLSFVLEHTPLFSMTTIFGLLLAIIFRLQFVSKVPQKTLGVLVDRNGDFSALLEPGHYWIRPGSESIKEYLSLEPTITQMPLLRLKASDGDVPAQVVIITWRVRPDMSKLAQSQFGPQVQTLAIASQQKREQFVRDLVEALIRLYLLQRTISSVEVDLADKEGHPLQKEIVRRVNQRLNKVGLQIDQIDLVGTPGATPQVAATSSTGAEEARKLIATARQKLERALRPAAPAATPQDVMQHAWKAHQLTSQVRKDISDIGEAVSRYVTSVSDVFGPLHRQAKPRPDLTPIEQARQESFDRLNQLQQDVGILGQQLILLDQQAGRLPSAPFGLTPSEYDRLFEVLGAIERKVIKLDDLYK